MEQKSLLNSAAFASDYENPNNYICGCLVGAMIGDALGASLEFNISPSPKQLAHALSMSGEGPYDLAPGQLTDSMELALAQAHGLTSGKGELCLDEIAKNYGFWVNSKPFGIGVSTRNAFRPLQLARVPNWDAMNPKGLAKLCISSAKGANTHSESNGGLMRITPLAIWCSKLSDADLSRAVSTELSITHPSLTVHEAGISYCIAIRHLVNNLGDMKGAYKKVKEYVMKNDKCRLISWLNTIEKGENLPLATENMSWVKIPWTYTMYFLKNEETNFQDVMRRVLECGGDTAANACIVGGMLGTAIGIHEIPDEWVSGLKEIDVTDTKLKHPRDVRYNPATAWGVLSELLQFRPTKLIFS